MRYIQIETPTGTGEVREHGEFGFYESPLARQVMVPLDVVREIFRLAERVRELEGERVSLADFLNTWAREQSVPQIERLDNDPDDRDPLKRLADRIWGELNIRDGRSIARIAALEAENAAMRERLTLDDAHRIACGCLDFGGGYRSSDRDLEIFHHGIRTVCAALAAAKEQGLGDPQVRVLHSMGAPADHPHENETHTGAPGCSSATRDTDSSG